LALIAEKLGRPSWRRMPSRWRPAPSPPCGALRLVDDRDRSAARYEATLKVVATDAILDVSTAPLLLITNGPAYDT
jgi:hypothetical protein